MLALSMRMAGRSRASGGHADDRLGRFQASALPELDPVYNYARFLCGDAGAADKIARDAFLRAFRAFDRQRGGDIRVWLLTFVRSAYGEWLVGRRSGGLRNGRGSPLACPAEGDTDALRTVLAALPRPLREVLVLREIEGLSYHQIADVTGLPVRTAMSRLARGREVLGKRWLARGTAPGAAR